MKSISVQNLATSRHKAQVVYCSDNLKGNTQWARTDFIWTNGFAEAAVSTDPSDVI
jgi:hypothetical protein